MYVHMFTSNYMNVYMFKQRVATTTEDTTVCVHTHTPTHP
jgi:hypothetical protein